MMNRRQSSDHNSQCEDGKDWGTCSRREISRRNSYHVDRRSDLDRRQDINRSSIRRDFTRSDDGRSRSPTSLVNATGCGSSRKSDSPSFATMQQAGAASCPPWRELTELLCDKMWCRVQCEQEKKREKKLCDDRGRCPPGNPETTHYSDILRLQIERCQKTRKKWSDLMNTADDKLMAGIVQLMESHAPHMLTSAEAANSGVEKEKLDVKLESLRQTVDAWVKQGKQDQEENNKLSASTTFKLSATTAAQAKLSKETEELKKSLELERQRNDRLAKRLEDIEHKFNALSQEQDKLAQETASNSLSCGENMTECSGKMKQVMQRLDAISVNTITRGELSSALEQFDNVMAPPADASYTGRQEAEAQGLPNGHKTRNYLRQLSTALDHVSSSLGGNADGAVPQCIADLQDQVSSCAESTQSQFKEILMISQSLKTLEESISCLESAAREKQKQSPALPPAPPPPSSTTTTPLLPTPPPLPLSASHGVSQQDVDMQMTRLAATLTDSIQKNMQEKLAKVAEQLGSFIDKERREREQASHKADDSCSKVESLQQSVDELRKYTHDSSSKQDMMCDYLINQLKQHKEGMASFDSRLQHVAMEHAQTADEVAMQLRVVNTWQSNFTTKPLYLDIVNHITKTLPNGLIRQVAVLAARVDALESQLRMSEAATKRPRLTE
ncbi:hypothetical protein E4U42_005357 [Claviceps africana]|uniref:Uncharacterized protein n=1 Tax=Claviceps africana TaxID=83212 RepID=A0A8K0J4V1_9HYPO|nr:hypothetical protein E4U42_005357 [Claviceps africana]